MTNKSRPFDQRSSVFFYFTRLEIFFRVSTLVFIEIGLAKSLELIEWLENVMACSKVGTSRANSSDLANLACSPV